MVLLLLAGVGCDTTDVISGNVPPPIPANSTPTGTQDEQIQKGDKIELFVMEDPGFNGVFVVREKGDIILPKLGRIPVLGLTLPSAEQRIQQALETDQLAKATVIADRVERARGTGRGAAPGQERILVYLTGRVLRPGQHAIPVVSGGTIGVFEAVMIAGGVASLGDDRKVYVLRKGGEGKRVKVPINLRKVRMGDTPDLPIGNGDIVVVPQARFLPL